MKFLAIITCLIVSVYSFAQPPKLDSIQAKVYALENSKPFASNKGNNLRSLFDGKGAVLLQHMMNLQTLGKKQMLTYSNSFPMEQFFIIKKGPVKITLNGKSAILDRGSVVLLLPGDGMRIENTGDDIAEYYDMIYQAKDANMERAKKAGPSFMMDWKDMVFKPTDKGGVRQLFDRQTAMLNRFDIHVTQLNEGNKSHDPHQHTNEEIILMLEGNAEMQIGTDHQKANPGDVVFLSSNILHNLTNIGKGACLYFAIQWN